MTICQHLTGDVRTEKRTKNIRDKGVVYQNNILNIKLMYSCCLLRISSANSATIVNSNRLVILKFHYIVKTSTIYSYTVMQLCSFKMRGMIRDKRNFIIYINIYNNYIFSKKTTKTINRAKNNCITA